MEVDILEEKIETKSGQNYFLPASIIIAGVIISASIIYAVGEKNAPRREGTSGANNADQPAALSPGAAKPLEISSRDVILGDPKAPVTIIEYGDYQCPFCGKFFTQVEGLLRENYIKTGKAKMVFRNFQFLGPESTASAVAAECAKDQSKFWAYHDALYNAEVQDGQEGNGNLNRDLFLKLAKDLSLDTAAFTNCLDGPKYESQIKRDTSAAQAVGVNSTPTSFINGEELRGALPYDQFKAVIDKFLIKK